MLGKRLDSESLREVMDRYFLREILEGHGGIVDKSIGGALCQSSGFSGGARLTTPPSAVEPTN